MRTLLKSALTLAAVAAMVTPAYATHNGETPPTGCRYIRGTDTPEDHTDDVYVCRKDTWIHAPAAPQGRIGNLAGFEQADLPSWNTTAPTGTTGGGGGSFYATNSIFHQGVAPQDPRGSFVAEGTFTGVLDNVVVDLFAYVTPIFSTDLNLQLTIDGESVFGARVDSIRNQATGNFRRIRFAFTNGYEALRGLGKANANDTQHTLALAANGVFVIDDPMVFAYDASDVPAGVVFNHDGSLSAYTQIDLAPQE